MYLLPVSSLGTCVFLFFQQSTCKIIQKEKYLFFLFPLKGNIYIKLHHPQFLDYLNFSGSLEFE